MPAAEFVQPYQYRSFPGRPSRFAKGSYHFESIASDVPGTVRELTSVNSNRPVSGAVNGAVASSTLLPILERMKHYYYRRSSHVRV